MGLIRKGKAQQDADMERHLDAWAKAFVRVQKVIDQHPLEGYVTINRFIPGVTFMSAAEQHIDLVIRVADWLLEEGSEP